MLNEQDPEHGLGISSDDVRDDASRHFRGPNRSGRLEWPWCAHACGAAVAGRWGFGIDVC
jgi:hypothetical protein